jgi:hypothetical protein
MGRLAALVAGRTAMDHLQDRQVGKRSEHGRSSKAAVNKKQAILWLLSRPRIGERRANTTAIKV